MSNQRRDLALEGIVLIITALGVPEYQTPDLARLSRKPHFLCTFSVHSLALD
ncbi:Hypothetical predicted protein, partial [Marmota monax]